MWSAWMCVWVRVTGWGKIVSSSIKKRGGTNDGNGGGSIRRWKTKRIFHPFLPIHNTKFIYFSVFYKLHTFASNSTEYLHTIIIIVIIWACVWPYVYECIRNNITESSQWLCDVWYMYSHLLLNYSVRFLSVRCVRMRQTSETMPWKETCIQH